MVHARSDYNRIQDPAGLIPEKEPVFLLRATDALAADIVKVWADRLEGFGGDPLAISLARKHADEMDAWPIKKLPDVTHERPGNASAVFDSRTIKAIGKNIPDDTIETAEIVWNRLKKKNIPATIIVDNKLNTIIITIVKGRDIISYTCCGMEVFEEEKN